MLQVVEQLKEAMGFKRDGEMMPKAPAEPAAVEPAAPSVSPATPPPEASDPLRACLDRCAVM